MLETLRKLGVTRSFSRPGVSNDNPYSESAFRTMKYATNYPVDGFQSVEAAQIWLDGFITWYNTEHLHSSLKYVTPEARHQGRDKAILAKRHLVYQAARASHPERWSGDTRDWSYIEKVHLNKRTKKANSA